MAKIEDWVRFIRKERNYWVRILVPYGYAHSMTIRLKFMNYIQKRKYLIFYNILGEKLDKKFVEKHHDRGYTFHFLNEAKITQQDIENYLKRDLLLLFEKIKRETESNQSNIVLPDVTRVGYRFLDQPQTLKVFHTFDHGLAFDLIGIDDDDELILEIARDLGRKFNQEEIAVGEVHSYSFVVVLPFYKNYFWLFEWLNESIRY